MKKFTLLTSAFFCIASFVHAQISKGTILLGGGISANNSKQDVQNDEHSFNGFSINPAIGFTVKENTVIGLRGSYGHTKTENSTSQQKINSYSLGVFMRKYLSLGKSFYLFGEGGVGYNHSNNTQITDIASKSIFKQNGISANLYPGIAYALNKRIHLEASINNLISLSYYKSEGETISMGNSTFTKYHSFSFDSNLSTSVPLSLGFRFVLGK